MKIPTKKDFRQISPYIWEIPKEFRSDMKVPARVFISEKMLDELLKEESTALWQLINLATLPGIYKYSLAMPDIHSGYGSPIGGVVAFDINQGIISPGICGYDINCGVRLLVTPFYYSEIKDKIPKLTQQIYKEVPSGVGEGGWWNLTEKEMENILQDGAQYLLKLGYATQKDIEHTESFGKLDGANPEKVSSTAKKRGKDQLGTIGAGNHFVEIQKVAQIFDEALAKKLNLDKDRVCVMIHCGSRGLGHQVATDYIKAALKFLNKNKIEIVDKELAYFHFNSSEARDYLEAMKSAANFAWANRQYITYEIRKAFKKVFNEDIEIKQIYDVAHNIVKIEEYSELTPTIHKKETSHQSSQLTIAGNYTYLNKNELGSSQKSMKLIIHRKGATRAFWQGHQELSHFFREIGQPILIPGSMGTASYVLIGQELAKDISFGSAPHGAGRVMSRTEAKKKIKGFELKKELEAQGISVAEGSLSGLAEEAPEAYKQVDEVVEVVHQIGIAKKVVKLKPLGVIKG